MFSALLNRAQATVDNAIGQVVNRAIIAVPFVLAGAFATAALALRLVREFGPETANLILAGIFMVVGTIVAIAFRARPANPSAEDVVPEALTGSDQSQTSTREMSAPDRELLMAALTSAAPIALPSLIRIVLRNLPLILALVAALFVMTRPSEAVAAEAEPATQ